MCHLVQVRWGTCCRAEHLFSSPVSCGDPCRNGFSHHEECILNSISNLTWYARFNNVGSAWRRPSPYFVFKGLQCSFPSLVRNASLESGSTLYIHARSAFHTTPKTPNLGQIQVISADRRSCGRMPSLSSGARRTISPERGSGSPSKRSQLAADP